jgi:hypothetical protein
LCFEYVKLRVLSGNVDETVMAEHQKFELFIKQMISEMDNGIAAAMSVKVKIDKQAHDINYQGSTLIRNSLGADDTQEVKEPKAKLASCEEWQRKVDAGITILQQTKRNCQDFQTAVKNTKVDG